MPEIITTVGTLPSVAIGAIDMALGVVPAPRNGDMIVDHELLGEPLGIVGDAAVIPDDELDLLAGDGVAVLRHVELDGGGDFLPGGADRAGHRQDEADLDGVLRGGAAGCQSPQLRSQERRRKYV